MVCLVSQGGTVLGYVVVGLRHVNDRFFIEGEGIAIKGPVSAVNLQRKRKVSIREDLSPRSSKDSRYRASFVLKLHGGRITKAKSLRHASAVGAA